MENSILKQMLSSYDHATDIPTQGGRIDNNTANPFPVMTTGPNISYFFDLCLPWASVVPVLTKHCTTLLSFKMYI